MVPERTDFLEGDAPAAAKVEAFLARALEATGSDAPTTAGALVPWICDALLSNHSVKDYGRDLEVLPDPLAINLTFSMDKSIGPVSNSVFRRFS